MYSSGIAYDVNDKPKTLLEPIYFTSNHYQQKLNKSQYSIKDLIQLASQVNVKHGANGCYQCHIVCGYYMKALKYAREQEPVVCNQDLFELVSEMINLVLSHRETSTYQLLPWFDMLTLELWDFAKQLKEESIENDLFIPASGIIRQDSIDSDEDEEDDEEVYKRAIRVSIYHCRALVSEQHKDMEQALVYYRKCASVRPTVFEPQPSLQKNAFSALQRLHSTRPTLTLKHRSSSAYSSDSHSYSSSQSFLFCSNCGTEKQRMPVCAKCKIQPYCSVRCMKSHKSTHELTCSKEE
jgi:hypothetical protein